MRWDEIDGEVCSIARTLSVVGDRWTLLVLRDSFLGVRRFSEYQKNIGLSRHRLADRLGKVVEHELLEKVLYQKNPPRYEYRLTPKGIDIYPVLLSLASWGNQWMTDKDGVPMEYQHRSCGHKTTPVLSCSECGETIVPQQITPLLGPGILKKLERGETGRYLPPLLAQRYAEYLKKN